MNRENIEGDKDNSLKGPEKEEKPLKETEGRTVQKEKLGRNVTR